MLCLSFSDGGPLSRQLLTQRSLRKQRLTEPTALDKLGQSKRLTVWRVSLYDCVLLFMSLYLSFGLYICMQCMCSSICLNVSFYPSVFLSICLYNVTLCLFLYICLYIYMYVSLCLSLRVFLSVCVSVYQICLYVYFCLSVCLHLSFCLFVCLHTSVCLSIWQSISASLFTSQHIHLPVCLSVSSYLCLRLTERHWAVTKAYVECRRFISTVVQAPIVGDDRLRRRGVVSRNERELPSWRGSRRGWLRPTAAPGSNERSAVEGRVE